MTDTTAPRTAAGREFAATFNDDPAFVADINRIEREAIEPLLALVRAARKALVEREEDLRWCNKDDDCHSHAEGVALAISDFDAVFDPAVVAVARKPE